MSKILDFLHGLSFDDLPSDVKHQAWRCLLDLCGVAAAGSGTELSRIIRDHAANHFGAGNGSAVRMLFDGRRVSPAGAALAGGMAIDSVDAHDGYPAAKGHAGAAVLPALLALAEGPDEKTCMDAAEFMTSLVIGYELAIRAGVTLHATAPDYHTSGAWVAVACAGLGARRLKLDPGRSRHALGIAEYHGPRSQMMRCIDHPTMLKDGAGWGAMAGVSAAYLAADGFTGAPAITLESGDAAGHWSDLGTRWLMLDQYFKPYPVCRWAQPATEAALDLRKAHGLKASDIDHVEVVSFHEACRLATREPVDTEAAQYSLPFPLAAALVHGELEPAQIDGAALRDPETLRLSRGMILSEEASYNAHFPAERFAHVALYLKDRRILTSEPSCGRGNAENPLSDAEIRAKFRRYTARRLSGAASDELEKAIQEISTGRGTATSLLKAVTAPALVEQADSP
ncbi:MmgE/PrpD family protein [Denitrobaculum tricleocarpae]|uniref:MmgE/PrpD family protein n=1 Tax=Denitrobaculum tricleocarpae TaxID=2591009 RepID=A0A545TGW2_9PROT|nr:MmgE/PrpD family protein [Denitrobaculum tricleocarpae]